MTEKDGLKAILFLVGGVILLMSMSKSPSVDKSYATGIYDANQPVISRPAEVSRAPAYSCTTKSFDGPYKHDGRTWSTECK